jgi:hypothetical protein
MNAKIEFKLQFTATPVFNSLFDWCFQMMCLFSGAPKNPEDDTVMQNHGAEALHHAEKSLMHAIRTKDKKHRMIQIAKPWMIRRWSEWRLANGKPLFQIPKENLHLIDLQWTERE